MFINLGCHQISFGHIHPTGSVYVLIYHTRKDLQSAVGTLSSYICNHVGESQSAVFFLKFADFFSYISSITHSQLGSVLWSNILWSHSTHFVHATFQIAVACQSLLSLR